MSQNSNKLKSQIIGVCFLVFLTNIALGKIFKPTECATDIRTLSVALEIYIHENGNYPPIENWEQELIDVADCVPEYFIDPWGNKYIYIYPGTHNKESFDIYSLGKDGFSETNGNDKDDINNWNPDKTWLYEAYGCPTKQQILGLLICTIFVGLLILFAIGYAVFCIYKKMRKRKMR